jgi:hypothetical protein
MAEDPGLPSFFQFHRAVANPQWLCQCADLSGPAEAANRDTSYEYEDPSNHNLERR